MAINETFAYHKPGAKGIDAIQRIREAYSKLLDTINDEVGSFGPLEVRSQASRAIALATTHLETSAMFATKALVCADPEAKVDG